MQSRSHIGSRYAQKAHYDMRYSAVDAQGIGGASLSEG